MRDKTIVGLLTIIFFALYFLPFVAVKFISIAFILFFAPGFFILRIYKKVSEEELILLSIPLSLGVSGFIALVLAALSILNPQNMLISIAAAITVAFIFSSSSEIKGVKIEKPEKLVTVIVVLSLILMGVWLYYGISTPKYKEVDIGILEWPENATLNDTLFFKIYVKNWDYDNASIEVVFKMNNQTMGSKSFYLLRGEDRSFYFTAVAYKEGNNLASFDLFVNGKYYTNVHVYFYVSS